MKVFRISRHCEVPDGTGGRRQVLAAIGGRLGKDPRFMLDEFKGKPFSRAWRPITYWVDKPLLPRPDFWGLPGGFVCNERAMTLAGEPLERCGEYLPVAIENEPGEFRFYHVTNCVNVLDPQRSGWSYYGPANEYRDLRKPAFRPERFGEETLFKIPEDLGVTAYCLERTGDPDDGEFKALVERHGLTGLGFELVWSEDDEDDPAA